MKKNVRIKDIAEMAQVSMGTVDRVLHRRGKVSAEAEAKVIRVLKEINYRPNVVAKTLSKARVYLIAVLMPHPDTDPFWNIPRRGIDEAEQQLQSFGIEVRYFPFDPYRSDSFREQADRALQAAPQGVLMAPVLQQESLEFARTCQQHHIPLVCFNTYVEALPSASFIGQDLHRSGRVAAELMLMGTKPKVVLIVHIAEHPQNSAHLYAKEQGFRQYCAEQGMAPDQLISLEIDDPDTAPEQWILPHDDVQGVFITTAKAYTLLPYLKNSQTKHGRVIGYDLTDFNVSCLRQGFIDVLIHQETRQQAFMGISYLADQLIFGQEIPTIKHLPLGIVTRENVDSYRSSD